MSTNGQVAILGAGVMGETLLSGLLRAGRRPEELLITERREERATELRERYGVDVLTNVEAAAKADTLVLVVKPQDMPDLLAEIAPAVRPEQTVVSLAAGITTSFIESRLPEGVAVVRVMPNTPALVDEGMAAISRGAHCDESHLVLAEGLLAATGRVIRVPEKQQDAVTAISGSGPAYIFFVVESMIEAGVHMGLPRSTATELVVQTVVGSAKLLRETGSTRPYCANASPPRAVRRQPRSANSRTTRSAPRSCPRSRPPATVPGPLPPNSAAEQQPEPPARVTPAPIEAVPPLPWSPALDKHLYREPFWVLFLFGVALSAVDLVRAEDVAVAVGVRSSGSPSAVGRAEGGERADVRPRGRTGDRGSAAAPPLQLEGGRRGESARRKKVTIDLGHRGSRTFEYAGRQGAPSADQVAGVVERLRGYSTSALTSYRVSLSWGAAVLLPAAAAVVAATAWALFKG